MPHRMQNTVVSVFQHGVCRSTDGRPFRRSTQGPQAVPYRHSMWSTLDARLCQPWRVKHILPGHRHALHHHTAFNNNNNNNITELTRHSHYSACKTTFFRWHHHYCSVRSCSWIHSHHIHHWCGNQGGRGAHRRGPHSLWCLWYSCATDIHNSDLCR